MAASLTPITGRLLDSLPALRPTFHELREFKLLSREFEYSLQIGKVKY